MPDNNEVQESPRESRAEAPPASLQASDVSPSASDVQNANRTGMDSAQNTVNKDFGTPSIGDMTQEAGMSKTDKTPKPEKSNADDSKMEVEPKDQDLYKTPVEQYPGRKPEISDDQGRNLDRPARPQPYEAPKDNRESGKLESNEGENPKSFEHQSPEDKSKTNFEFGENGKVDSRTTTDTASGNQERVKYDGDGKAQSKEVNKPGEAPESQPVDPNDTAKAEYDENGKLTSIATTKGNEKSEYNFSDGELKSKHTQNSGEVTKGADGKEKVVGRSDSRTAFEDGKEFESQKTNYNDEGVRTNQVNKRDNTTTTKHYDKAGENVEKTEKLGSTYHSMERDFADRKQVDTVNVLGRMSRDTTYTDGSTKSESYNPHTKERTMSATKDGYRAEMRDDPKSHQSTFYDKSGQWQRYDLNKNSGIMTETGSDGRRIVSRGS
ncbi:MAG: hypothetical protein IPO31_05720 [Candidatus Obscuribacter sp.]|nr:hypothetical protein [Candidatus Obscuribacter sp.]